MSKPMLVLPSLWAAYSLLITSLGLTPEFSASTRGMISSASANLLMLYCSSPGCVSAQADTYLATGQLYLRGSASNRHVTVFAKSSKTV